MILESDNDNNTPHRNTTMKNAWLSRKMTAHHVAEYIVNDQRNNAQMRDHHRHQCVVVYAYCTRKHFDRLVAKAAQVAA
jgi:hypothetical protein